MSLKSSNPYGLSPSLEKLARHGLLSADEERKLIRRAQRGDKSAEATLLQMNVRLIIMFTRKFHGRGLEADDVFQAGCLGFTRAIRKYDLRRKDMPRLATYASWWVKAIAQRAVLDEGRTVRLPSNVGSEYRRAVASGSSHVNWSDPEGLDRLSARLRAAQMTETVSFDQPYSGPAGHADGSEDSTMLDFLRSPAPDGESELLAAEERQTVESCLNRLRKIEREVLQARFFRGLTLDATADDLFRRKVTTHLVSREYARQIEKRAKQRLKAVMIEAGLNPET